MQLTDRPAWSPIRGYYCTRRRPDSPGSQTLHLLGVFFYEVFPFCTISSLTPVAGLRPVAGLNLLQQKVSRFSELSSEFEFWGSFWSNVKVNPVFSWKGQNSFQRIFPPYSQHFTTPLVALHHRRESLIALHDVLTRHVCKWVCILHIWSSLTDSFVWMFDGKLCEFRVHLLHCDLCHFDLHVCHVDSLTELSAWRRGQICIDVWLHKYCLIKLVDWCGGARFVLMCDCTTIAWSSYSISGYPCVFDVAHMAIASDWFQKKYKKNGTVTSDSTPPTPPC